jgi:hypothetical protein
VTSAAGPGLEGSEPPGVRGREQRLGEAADLLGRVELLGAEVGAPRRGGTRPKLRARRIAACRSPGSRREMLSCPASGRKREELAAPR